MSKTQEIINNLQFAHSYWLNELSHAEVELTIMANRLDLLEASSTVPKAPSTSEAIALEIEQLQLAAQFIKKTVMAHVSKIYNLAKANGQLEVISNAIHDETKERLAQFRTHFQEVRQKFYALIPIEDQI